MSKPRRRGGISFDVSGDDQDLIEQIAARAVSLAIKGGFIYQQIDAVMDITACHANGCPLRLKELLAADEGNFWHDVFGINRFLDRDNGKLGGCFLPRYSVPQKSKQGLESK